MFRGSEILGAYRHRAGLSTSKRTQFCGGERLYWTVVVDVGSYTTDIAVVGFDLDNPDERFDDEERLRAFSQPIGVMKLDSMVEKRVGVETAACFRKLSGNSGRIERYHRAVYGSFRLPYQIGGGVKIGEGSESEAIRECIREFADEVAEFAETYLNAHRYGRIDTLILTGGGCAIPAVRDSLSCRLKDFRTQTMNSIIYIPTSGADSPKSGFRPLPPTLVRAATAIGGASVFFDFT
jgi:hypothetical protein